MRGPQDDAGATAADGDDQRVSSAGQWKGWANYDKSPGAYGVDNEDVPRGRGGAVYSVVTGRLANW